MVFSRTQWIRKLGLFTLWNICLFLLFYYHPRIPFQFIYVNQTGLITNQSCLTTEKSISTFQSRLNRRWFHLGQIHPRLNLSLLLHIQNSSQQTLTYSCLKDCGGWGDRLRGLTSTYVLAVFLQRRFQIDMPYPMNLHHFLRPNLIDWQPMVNGVKSLQLDLIHGNYSQELLQNISHGNLKETWKDFDHIHLMTNHDYITPLLKNPHFSSIKTQLNLAPNHSTQADLFALIFELLFQPTRPVLNQLDRLFEKTRRYSSTICTHIRLGQNPTVPKDMKLHHRDRLVDDMIGFIDRNLHPRHSSIFVTSDSDQAQEKIVRYYGQERVLTMEGPIIHIDRFHPRLDSKDRLYRGFLKVIVDFYFLGECDTILKPRSGFSEWANHRRLNEYQNFFLYCRGFHRVSSAKWRRPHAIC